MSSRTAKLLCGLLVVCLTAGAAVAQDQIANKVPANAMGFLVVNNVRDMTTKVDQWIEAVGLTPMLQPQMPEGALVAMMQGAMLGEGFNADGSFGVILLDPQAYGVKMPWAEATTQPDTEATAPAMDQEQKWPFVLMVPGASTEAVFGNYEITKEGEYNKVQLRMGEMYSKDQNGYVMLSPITAALDAVTANTTPMQLGQKHRRLMSESQIALHINMAVAQPLIDQGIEYARSEMQKQADSPFGPPAGVIQMWDSTMSFYQTLIKQTQAVTADGQFAPTGVVVRKMVEFKADSGLKQAFASYKMPGTSLVDRLVSNEFAVAAGVSQVPESPQIAEFRQKLITQFMGLPQLQDIPAEQKAQFEQAVNTAKEQVRQVQVVLGGTGGPGVFGIAEVLVVQDAQKMRQAIKDLVPFYQQLIAKLAEEEPDAAGVTVQYAEAAQTVNGKPVDMITISSPDIEQSFQDTPEVQQALGQSKLEIYVANAADNVMVISFGGGTEFLTQAMTAAAQPTNAIGTTPGIEETNQYLPANRLMTGYFNLAGLFALAQRVGEMQGQTLPFAAEGTVPLALGLGTEEDGVLRASLYIPNTMVKDIANIAMQMMMGFGGGQPQPSTMEGEGEPPAEQF